MIAFNEKELEAINEFIDEHVSSSKRDCYRNNNPNHNNLEFYIKLCWIGIEVATSITCNCCSKTKIY